MSLLSHSLTERANKAHGRLLKKLEEPGSQVAIAATLGVSESTISRIKNERLPDVLPFIYACGYKLVPVEDVSVKQSAWDFLLPLFLSMMSDPDMAHRLFEEDE